MHDSSDTPPNPKQQASQVDSPCFVESSLDSDQESEKESEKRDDERDMKCASSMCVCVYVKGESESER